jgi:phosphohistidine phosphatase
VTLFLVHHGDAVGPEVDTRRPLSTLGQRQVAALAAEAVRRGANPAVVWHSGKLRARQTAEALWRACNPFAEFSAARDLQPSDPIVPMRDRLRGETRDLLIAGHFPHLPRLLASLVSGRDEPADFPAHGLVALSTADLGQTWVELWRAAPDD